MSDSNNMEYEREVKLMNIKGAASCDYPLPDYLGDVKKIIKYSAEIIPNDKFSGGAEVSFLFSVEYRVMYLDREDVLTEACFSSEFEHTERVSDGFIDAYAVGRVENLTIRLQGPRKICAKAGTAVDVYIRENAVIPVCELPSDAERSSVSVKMHFPRYSESGEREYAERIASIEDLSCDEVETVKCRAFPVTESVKAIDEGVEIKGYVIGSAILRARGDVMRVEKRIPFAEVIPFDAISKDGCAFTAKVYATDAALSLNNEITDAESAACYLSVVLSYALKCVLKCDTGYEYTLVKDAFLPGMKNSASYSDFTYNELIASFNEKRKVSLEIPRPEEAIREIVECDAELKGLRYEIAGEELTVFGEVVFSAAASLADGVEFIPVKHSCPFEEKIKIKGGLEGARADLGVTVSDIGVSFDNEKLYPGATLDISAVLLRSNTVSVISGLSCEETEKKGNCMRVYYPTSGDTLWNIAKRYAVSVFSLMKANTIAIKGIDDSLDDMKYILIPI